MGALELEVYEIFKTSLGEEKAGKVIQLFESKAEDKFNQKKDVLATKEDITNLKLDIANIRTDMKEQKSEIIKWMFIFWASQIGATIGFLMIYLKYIAK